MRLVVELWLVVHGVDNCISHLSPERSTRMTSHFRAAMYITLKCCLSYKTRLHGFGSITYTILRGLTANAGFSHAVKSLWAFNH
jgi:hypothetical protein